MPLNLLFPALILGAVPAVAGPAVNCTATSYTDAAIKAATDRSCQVLKSRTGKEGSPYHYSNSNGHSFAVDGPYVAYPILKSGTAPSNG